MDLLKLAVISRSRKENEQRLPLHPAHLERVPEEIRQRVYLETGYAETFGIPDSDIAHLVGGMRDRAELIDECDVVLLAKPQFEDLQEMRAGQTLWGWPHCVQDQRLTQVAIDQKLTLIAFEAMNHWAADGSFNLHVFHKNNEIAGYASVLHALRTIGSTGHYGSRMSAAVVGFGATARGAVTALNAIGVHDVQILTNRSVAAVGSPIHSAEMLHFARNDDDPRRSHVDTQNGPLPLADVLAEHDIIVNCVLQDTNDPLLFLIDDDLALLKPGALIVDVSCDEGMGFSWARPTSFADPTFVVGNNVHYYGVDHSPSYLWNSASWEISDALLPYLEPVLTGAWDGDDTIRRSIEIRDGVIQNPNITAFQNRAAEYPHRVG
ncbi:N(5)-(carboxyethyl)ornithine synthase [soil metagenome]